MGTAGLKTTSHQACAASHVHDAVVRHRATYAGRVFAQGGHAGAMRGVTSEPRIDSAGHALGPPVDHGHILSMCMMAGKLRCERLMRLVMLGHNHQPTRSAV